MKGEEIAMRFGFVLLTSPTRKQLRDYSLASLARTNVEGLEKPVLWIVYREAVDIDQFKNSWAVSLKYDKGLKGVNKLYSYFGAQLEMEEPITHIGFLVDDFAYNPRWLLELYKLINRHEGAKAWSVYRSRYTRHHRILKTDEFGDCLMTKHDCLGTMTVEEWKEYNPLKITDFSCSEKMGGGDTIDLYHAENRPGERWATGRDYMQNLGRHPGIEEYDCAIDFVGEQA